MLSDLAPAHATRTFGSGTVLSITAVMLQRALVSRPCLLMRQAVTRYSPRIIPLLWLAACTEVGYKARLCACGVTTDVTTVPALGHNFVNGKCSVCGAIEVAVPNTSVPYVTAAVDGVKDAAYDSGVKYYVNGATAYLLYDKDYFYVYVEADEGENVTYFTLGNPDKTDTVGPFWSHTASVKFDFNAKNVTTKGWEYGVFNQNGQSTFADNISVDGGDTCLAKAGTDYVFADGAKAAELRFISARAMLLTTTQAEPM